MNLDYPDPPGAPDAPPPGRNAGAAALAVAPPNAAAVTPRLLRHRWARRAAWAAGALALLWLVSWLAVPPLVRWQAQAQLTELLGRPVTVAAVSFEPWSLALTVEGIAVGPAPGAASAGPLLQVSRLRVDASLASLARRAPVVEALEIDGLRLAVARTGPGRYDIDDLLARFAPRPDAPPSQPAQFALYNLQLRDGELRFDDRPAGQRHVVDAITLALPFVSNLPSAVDVKVEPRLAFRANGAAFDTGAQATPFAATRSGELRVAFQDLDVSPYRGYLPEALPVRLREGRLAADLRLRFALAESGPSVSVQGRASAQGLALTDAKGMPLLGWRALAIELTDVQPLARRLDFGLLRVDGAEFHLRRGADGRLELPTAAAPPAAASAPAAPAASAAASAPAEAAWRVRLARIELADARVRWNDAAVRPAVAWRIDGLAVRAEPVQWPVQTPVRLAIAGTLHAEGAAEPVGSFALDGTATDRDAEIGVRADGWKLEALAPYTAQALVARLGGSAWLHGRLDWSARADAPRLAVTLDEAGLDDLRLTEGAGRTAAEGATLKQLRVAGAQIDVLGRSAAIDSVRLVQPAATLARGADGLWNAARWAVAAPAAAGAAAAPASSPGWGLRVKNLSLEGGQLRLSDALVAPEGGEPPLRLVASGVRLAVQDLAWPSPRGTPPARVQFAARVGPGSAPGDRDAARAGTGSIDWKGSVLPEPLAVRGTLRAERLPLHLAMPYAMRAMADPPALSLLRAEAGYSGTIALQALPAGLDLQAEGDMLIGDLVVQTRGDATGGPAGRDELLSWQALALKGLRASSKPADKPRIEIAEVTLSDFFSRLVITEQGRFNLRDVAGAPAVAAGTAAASAPPANVAASAAAGAAVPSAGLPVVIAIGATTLRNGRVDFTDRFVRPNYSADLTELNGRLGAFRSDSREMAALELRGRAAGTALLEIVGQLNPTAEPLALDIRARASDLELAPLSPYAGKYAGYAIERGKLTMDVAYRIDPDGKLTASNQIILNQLTFGDRIESPDATKLPVQLALALLKDRNGVIDINLPISGSINDPQFSVFGIVLKIIGNLLVKALTAPFSLLFGGGSDELSLVEFAPGTVRFTDAGRGTIDKVAKALADRPALKMTVTGASDPVSEREAFQVAALDARVAAERRRELLRAGASPADAPPPISADDRVRLVRELYRTADIPDKPRNALGFARDIPVAEMEARLRARTVVGVEAMRELALQRGIAVRDALLAQGLPGERLFLAAPKLRASGEDDAAWTPRVQLQLSTP